MPHDDLRVAFPGDRPLAFERALEVVRAREPGEVAPAFSRIDRALREGHYCAGYVTYEAGAALAGMPVRAGLARPLLVLGIYTAPALAQPHRAAVYRMGPPVARMREDAYRKALERIAHAIVEGDVYQVNFTLPFDFAFEGDARALFEDLLAAARPRYAAFVEDGPHAILSLSPELFVERLGSAVRTRPMKGTAARGERAALASPKNRAEHVMIVDLLRNDLNRICTDVRVRSLYDVEEYPTLATMTSTIEGETRPGTSLVEFFTALFPCGSITGAPKRAAMEVISRLEPWPRECYTGSVGYFAPDGSGRWNVAIRTLQIDRASGRGRLDAGGGIVADSGAAAEWNEALLKLAFVEPFVTPFALLETLQPSAPRARAHLDRMERSAAYFSIPFDRAHAQRELAGLPALALARVRLDAKGTLSVEARDGVRRGPAVRLCVASAHLRTGPLRSHKVSWRDAYDEAAAQAERAACFDAILFNERGEIADGARTTIFVERDGVLWTPPLTSGALPGILRAELLREGRAHERVLYEADLRTAGALYAGNSARGLLRAELVRMEHAGA